MISRARALRRFQEADAREHAIADAYTRGEATRAQFLRAIDRSMTALAAAVTAGCSDDALGLSDVGARKRKKA